MKTLKTALLMVCFTFLLTACSSNTIKNQSTSEGQETDALQETNDGSIKQYETSNNGASTLEDPAVSLELQYTMFLIEASATLSEALDAMSTQSSLMAEDVSLILDESWKMSSVISMAMVQAAAQSFIDYDTTLIPEHMQEIHNLVVLGCYDYIDSMSYFADGIDNINPDSLETSAYLMQNGTNYIIEATNKLNATD